MMLVIVIIKFPSVVQSARRLGWLESSRTEHYKQMIAFHRRIDSIAPKGAVLFIGDSFIQSICVAAITEKAVNFGIGGDTTEGVLRRLPLYASIKKAKAIVLLVGYNDLRERDNNAIIANYREIFKRIPENCTILFCSVLPTDERCRPERFNDRITALNHLAAEMCSLRKGCYFLDMADGLTDSDGNLSRNFHEGDGIHLNSIGYKMFSQKLRLQPQIQKAKTTQVE